MQPLKKTTILGYTIGDLGMNLNFQLVGFYLTYFYTDVFGIPPYHIAGLFLAARIWDAINDPLMGFVADHTRTRWGQFRPYLLFGAIPLNIALVLCFSTPDISVEMRIVYAYVTYIMHGMLYTMVGLPYSSITAVMTQDPQERSVISSCRMFFAIVVVMSIMGVGGRPFVNLFSSEQAGFQAAAALCGVFSVVLIWVSFRYAQERVPQRDEGCKLKDIIPIILRNDALLWLSLAICLNTGVWVIGNTVTLHYFKYILGNENLQTIFFLYMIPCNALGAIVAPMLTRRYGKKNIFIFGSAIVSVLYISRYFVPDENLNAIIALSAAATVGQMLCSVAQWAMVPDTVEYGDWKNGVRSEGIPFSFFSFMQKSGMALAGSFAALVMSLTGFEANTELVPSAEAGIRFLVHLAPGICAGLTIGALVFYKLNDVRFREIVEDLEARNKQDSTAKSM